MDLLGSSELKQSTVSSDMLTNSFSCIRLTNVFGRGGSPAINDTNNELVVGASGVLLESDCLSRV